jgi:hypothetical protein
MSDTLLGLQWPAPARSEIRLTIIMLHGEGYRVFSESRLTFPDTEEGRARAQFAMAALPYISEATESRIRHLRRDGDKVCAAAAREMNLPEEDLISLFSTIFVEDARYPTYLALPIAYTLEHHTEEGIRRAVFPYRIGKVRHFQVTANLRNFNPVYLRHWD